MADVVDILLRLRGSRQFQSEADKSAKSIGRIGTDAEDAGKKAGIGWKGMAKWAGGAAALAGTARFLKGSVSATTDLAKSTMALERSTGLDAETASAWAAVTKARGIETSKFQMSLTKLSRTMEGAKAGSATATKALDALNVSQGAIAAGDVQRVLMESADAYKAMENPAQKAALAQQLFGRQALALTPLLSGGSEGIREQLALADKYGLAMGENTVEAVKKAAASQREMTMASQGLKVAVGTSLVPAITSALVALTQLVGIMQPFLRNSTLVKVVLLVVATAFITYKVAAIAATLATLSFNVALLLIPLAIVAVVAGLVILYKRSEWLRNALDAIWKWLKTAATDTAKWITNAWRNVVDFIGGLPDKITSAASGMWDGIKEGFRSAINFVIRGWNSLEFKVPGFDAGPVHFGGFTLGVPDIPELATGGLIRTAGAAIVGERGPELVTLPAGANVIPTPAIATVGAPPPLDGGASQTIVTKVFLDRRQIAEAVGTYVADKRARR